MKTYFEEILKALDKLSDEEFDQLITESENNLNIESTYLVQQWLSIANLLEAYAPQRVS